MSTVTTLRASPEAANYFAATQLLGVLEVVRRKIEDRPRVLGAFRGAADKVARSIQDRRLDDARDQIGDLLTWIAVREEDERTALQASEQERLAQARGQDTDTADDGSRTRDGYIWLRRKGKIIGSRAEAGEKLREHFANAESPLRSCINDQPGGGGGNASPSEAYGLARFELDGLKGHMKSAVGSGRASYLYALLEAVVGRGETIRQITGNKDREGERVVVELCCALDMAAARFGMVRG